MAYCRLRRAMPARSDFPPIAKEKRGVVPS